MSVVTVQVTEVSDATPTEVYTPVGFAARVTIQNLGPNPIYIGSAGVDDTTGYKVLTNASFTLEEGTSGPLWAIATTAAQVSPNDTRVLIEPIN